MITPIRCGVDTLEATFQGTIDLEVTKELFRRKTAAQVANAPDPIRINGENLFVTDRAAKFYPYAVKNRDLQLWIGVSDKRPAMQARLLAEGLASRGVGPLWMKCKDIGTDLELTPLNLTRIDVAVDFQGWVPTNAEMLNVVCKSNFRPVYPNATTPQTFQFGKGQVVVRLYDKTAEIAEKNKMWWHNVWKLMGYDPSLPVWRLEVQLRSTALKELGCRDVDKALDNIHGLFTYGLDWCSLRAPGSDSNLRRCPEHQAWIDLRENFTPAGVLGRIRPVVGQMSYDAAVARCAGNLRAAAVASEITDLDELLVAVKADMLRYLHNRREMDWEMFVEDKRRHFESGD